MDNGYYELATVRKVRRYLRRSSRSFTRELKFSCKGTLILRDDDGSNILRSRKVKNRIRHTEKL